MEVPEANLKLNSTTPQIKALHRSQHLPEKTELHLDWGAIHLPHVQHPLPISPCFQGLVLGPHHHLFSTDFHLTC